MQIETSRVFLVDDMKTLNRCFLLYAILVEEGAKAFLFDGKRISTQ